MHGGKGCTTIEKSILSVLVYAGNKLLITQVTSSCRVSLFTNQGMPSSSLKSVQLLPHQDSVPA